VVTPWRPHNYSERVTMDSHLHRLFSRSVIAESTANAGPNSSYLNLAWRVLKDIPEFRDPICKAAEELRKRAEKDGKTIDTSKFI
jgi:hypothetical protein